MHRITHPPLHSPSRPPPVGVWETPWKRTFQGVIRVKQTHAQRACSLSSLGHLPVNAWAHVPLVQSFPGLEEPNRHIMGNQPSGRTPSHSGEELADGGDGDTLTVNHGVKDQLFEHVKDRIFLDSSREILVKVMASDVERLVQGKLEGLNRCNLLLLGRKSIGKTTLLDAAECACRAILATKVAVVSIEASRDSDRLCDGLLLFVARAVGCPVGFFGKPTERSGDWAADGGLAGRIKELSAFLQASKKKVVVFIDELQDVCTDDHTTDASKLVLEELQNLVGLSGGLFCVVATGSSCHLRALAFCKMDVDAAHEIGMTHHTKARDLNSTKMRPMWMRPVVGAKDFLDFLKRHCPPMPNS